MALPKLDSPHYEMKIPSTGKKITFRPYLVKEEKILMLALESKDDSQMVRAVKDVIRACTDDAVDVEDMPMFDMEYIFTQLRSKSVGETTKIGISCQSCNHKNDIDINLDNIRVDVPKAKERKIELTPIVGMVLKYPTVNEVLDAQVNSTSSDVDKMFDMLASCIDSIYSGDEVFDAKSQTKKELKDFIESLNT